MSYNFDNIIQSNLQGQRSLINKVLHSSPMFDVDAVEIKGRMIRFGDHWVADFASCNYLGFDLDETIISSVEPALRKWGVHPSWCRLVASPSLYNEAEEKLADLIGCEDTLILPTVTLIGIGVIPALAGSDGVIFLDKTAHMTMYEATKIARDSGSKLVSFNHRDYNKLEDGLKTHKDNPKKLILVDGAYSMTGNYADLNTLVELAARYNAILYVDDAHGFGVIGENPDSTMPYGHQGNGIVKYFAQQYDNILYVGGLSKAYSSLAAFISCDKAMKQFLKAFATPYDLSGPCPTASLQSLLTGLQVNERHGDKNRADLFRLTKKAIDGLRGQGFYIDNETYFPIASVWIGDTDHLIRASEILWQEGILVTLSPYPMVKKGSETLRITVTAANTDAEVDMLLRAFAKVKTYLQEHAVDLQPHHG
jgi:8-amino-7-oxononanoate synthase